MSLFADLTAGVNAVRPGRTHLPNFDGGLVLCVSVLVLFGALMVYSASIALPDSPRYANYGRYDFALRHGLYVLLGLCALAATLTISMQTWHKLAVPLFLLSTLLLILVLIPGIGFEANGARRWLRLGGISFQPSELMKIAVLLFAATYTAGKQAHLQNVLRGFVPMACTLGLVGILLLLEPDLGALIVVVGIAMGLLFIGGLNIRLFSSLTSVLVSSFALLIWLSPWRRERIFAYLDPWNPDNVFGSAYQLSHSLIALGRGQWLGVGLGSSVEKLHYLPEAHTDFILAVIGEELGFVGVLVLMLGFAWIVWRGFDIGRQAIAMDRIFNGLVAQGVALWLGMQTFINMGMCMGLLPTKGLTLPLVSYGGSGLVMNFIAVGLLLRVDFERRIMMRGGRA